MSAEMVQFLETLRDEMSGEIRVAVFGQVTAFNASGPQGPRVDVQPQVKEPVRTIDGERSFESVARLVDVPVLYPQAGAGISITFPLHPGDTVLLVIPARDFSHWFASGQESPAHDDRTHSIGNAVALPCGFSLGRGPQVHATGFTIQSAEILLGGITAALHAAVAEQVNAKFNQFLAAYAVHTHVAPPSGGTTAGPVSIGPQPPSTPVDVGSSVVKLSG